MLGVFDQLADWLTFSVLGLEPSSSLGASVQFFVMDVAKIFFCWWLSFI